MNSQKIDNIFQQKIDELKNKGLFNTIRILESANKVWTKIDGRDILNFNSNNFLGFSNDSLIKQAAKDAIEKFGVGPGAVRSISGSNVLHRQLEKELATFKGTEDALVVQSGYTSNTALIPTIFGPDDCIISDALNHASIIDAIRLSKANKMIYQHSNMVDLETKVKEATSKFPGMILIITDGVFSMDGEICNLPKIVAIAKKYGALTCVDDAWGELGLGAKGLGTSEHYEVDVDFEVGSLSKGFGIQGGFICGKKTIIEYLRQRSRPFIFSTGLGIPECGAALQVLKELRQNTKRIETLHRRIKYFKDNLAKLGFTNNSQTQIQPVFINDEKKAQAMSKMLFEKEGIFVTPIVFPTVPRGTARCRFIISAEHSEKDLDLCIVKIAKCAQKLNIKQKK